MGSQDPSTPNLNLTSLSKLGNRQLFQVLPANRAGWQIMLNRIGLVNGVEPVKKSLEVLRNGLGAVVNRAYLEVGRGVFNGEGAGVELAVSF